MHILYLTYARKNYIFNILINITRSTRGIFEHALTQARYISAAFLELYYKWVESPKRILRYTHCDVGEEDDDIHREPNKQCDLTKLFSKIY